MPRNYFRLRLSPEVVIGAGALVKRSGEEMRGEPVELIARHHTESDKSPYERLLGDAVRGDTSLFTQDDCVEAAWRVVDPVLQRPVARCVQYDPGTWGPPAGGRGDRGRRQLAQPDSRDTPRRAERRTTSYFCWTWTTPCSTTTASAPISASAGTDHSASERASATGRSSRSCARNSASPTTWAACRCFAPGSTTIRGLLGMSRIPARISVPERCCSRGRLQAIAHSRTLGRPVILSDGDIVFQPRKIQHAGHLGRGRRRRAHLLHKEKVLDHVQQRYPASHYVVVDDKPNLLAAMKIVSCRSRLTTVFVRQGHYALARGVQLRAPAARSCRSSASAICSTLNSSDFKVRP